jgi:hypothetical protein
MNSKIKQKLSDYLEFDSDKLFQNKYNLVRVFGGAIRDIIADQPINDIDILCGSKAFKFVESILENNGYTYFEYLNAKHLQEMYKDIHIINEPHTWIKGAKIVQVIRPTKFKNAFFVPTSENYEESFNNLIANVDLSCCGVSYDGELHEDFKNAIIHCQSMVYSVNFTALMYSENRAMHRRVKLQERGWKEILNETWVNRDLKINLALE